MQEELAAKKKANESADSETESALDIGDAIPHLAELGLEKQGGWLFSGKHFGLSGGQCTTVLISISVSYFRQILVSVVTEKPITPLQKVQQVLLWLPATISAPYELPGSGLSKNIKKI